MLIQPTLLRHKVHLSMFLFGFGKGFALADCLGDWGREKGNSGNSGRAPSSSSSDVPLPQFVPLIGWIARCSVDKLRLKIDFLLPLVQRRVVGVLRVNHPR